MRFDALDARVKLWMLIALSTTSLISREPLFLLCLVVYTFILLVIGGVPIKSMMWKLRAAISLIASIFVLQCLFERSGEPLIRLFNVTIITHGGVNAALYVMLRLFTILFSALIVLSGNSRDYLLALNQLRLPYEISFMVMAGLRFLPILAEEARDVLYAVQMRGMKIKGTSLKNKLSIYFSVSIPIVAGAIRRSEKMAVAMEARAFRAMPKRTSMRRLAMKKGDWIWFIIFNVILALIIGGGIYIRHYYHL